MNCVCRPLNRRIVCALYIYFYTMARFAIYILDNTIFFQGPQIRVHALPENNFFKVNKKSVICKKKIACSFSIATTLLYSVHSQNDM